MKEFIDEMGNVFEVVDKEIGKGAQGVVYKTTDADIAIKIILKNEKEINDLNKIKLIQRDIKKIIYKPIPQDIPIAKPLNVLKDKAGYVMYLLEDMNPLEHLFPQKLAKNEEINIPFFLEEFAKKDKRGAEFIAFYMQSGSLRLRTKLLSRIAAALHRLHCRGLVYGDISYNNIYFNKDGIFLIDADNIEYAFNITHSIYTPEFEVPEIMEGENNSIYSDIYSYAILAYYLLTMHHPFDGALLENEWDNENNNIWEIPWIEDSKDSSNESRKVSLRGPLTITDELDRLFHKVFEEGKINKYKRPSLALWAEAFEKAYSITIKCPKCSMTYYNTLENCPYCYEKKPKIIEIESFYLNGQKRWSFAKEDCKKISVKNYIFKPFGITNMEDEFLEILKTSKEYKLIFKTTDKILINNRIKTEFIYKIDEDELKKGIILKVKDPIEIDVKIRIRE